MNVIHTCFLLMKVDESYEERKNLVLFATMPIPVAVASNLCQMEQNQEPNNILASDLTTGTGTGETQDQRKNIPN